MSIEFQYDSGSKRKLQKRPPTKQRAYIIGITTAKKVNVLARIVPKRIRKILHRMKYGRTTYNPM